MIISLFYVSFFCVVCLLIFFLFYRDLRKSIVSLFAVLTGFNIFYSRIVVGTQVYGSIFNYRMLQLHILDIIIVVLLSTIVSYIIKEKITIKLNEHYKFLYIFALLFLGLQTFLSVFFYKDVISLIGIIRIFVYSLTAGMLKYIWDNISLKTKKAILKSVSYGVCISLLFNLLVGIYQLTFSCAVGLTMFGESPISRYSTNIALLRVGEFFVLRAYGFFSHPNVLAAYSLLNLIFFTECYDQYNNLFSYNYKKIFYLVTIFVIIITFSKSVIICLVFYISYRFFHFKKRKISKLIPKMFVLLSLILFVLSIIFSSVSVISTQSVDIRSYQIKEAFNYIVVSFPSSLLGTGYTRWLFVTAQNPLILENGSLFIQPVHNLFILLLVELGVATVVFFIYILKRLKLTLLGEKVSWAFLTLVFLGLFDHYFLTIPVGIMMFISVLIFA